jgi:hypothetical protein
MVLELELWIRHGKRVMADDAAGGGAKDVMADGR